MSAWADRFRETAVELGDTLCRDAIWWGDDCVWLGDTVGAGDGVPVLQSCGADLYHGTAGIGLFLAKLATLTHISAHWEAASGAISHSLNHTDEATRSKMGSIQV